MFEIIDFLDFSDIDNIEALGEPEEMVDGIAEFCAAIEREEVDLVPEKNEALGAEALNAEADVPSSSRNNGPKKRGRQLNKEEQYQKVKAPGVVEIFGKKDDVEVVQQPYKRYRGKPLFFKEDCTARDEVRRNTRVQVELALWKLKIQTGDDATVFMWNGDRDTVTRRATFEDPEASN